MRGEIYFYNENTDKYEIDKDRLFFVIINSLTRIFLLASFLSALFSNSILLFIFFTLMLCCYAIKKIFYVTVNRHIKYIICDCCNGTGEITNGYSEICEDGSTQTVINTIKCITCNGEGIVLLNEHIYFIRTRREDNI